MTNSYQELIIRDAIEKHFEAEIPNFLRENDYQLRESKTYHYFLLIQSSPIVMKKVG